MKNNRITSTSMLCMFSLGCLLPAISQAALVLDCKFNNGRSFIDSSYTVTAKSDAASYTNFNGTIVVFLTQQRGFNTIEQRYERYGHVKSNNDPVKIVTDAVPYRLQNCTAVFTGNQSDR